MTWTQESYANKIEFARLMVSGLRNHLEQLSRRGLDEAFVNELEELVKTASNKKHRQASLKAQLKKETATLNQVIKELGQKVSGAKKIVKIDIHQPLWKGFGIKDKR
ncbi:MAG: hypothetical protein PVH61_23175 [Candidatus Aminicenantes bacterium]|jgi:hypothetical protein